MSIRETKPVAKIDTYEKKVFFTTEVRKSGEELYTEEQVIGLIAHCAAYIGGYAHGMGRHGENTFEEDVPIIVEEIQKWINGKEEQL
ncbi:hypothetical protein IL308_11320 [Lactococcus lactis]|uniref:hypothetical protein n=1 Tax=Lactococcus lactis TaxID=1358 RepID=UPI0019131D03|nr:hypothetical protein [Lactococcus lactis]MBK5077344.1 hypothetical protein [Lactococcus lactis]MCT2920654.1 hypothetical protein [Lactococcus lactis]MDT2878100.1 hypothetical protein [Lactococcus lactis]MDT2885928.1 hypothetical protein [Lactococcus lactis]MDT2902171.1 hypothetical protein [Lactococcus lactis]